MTSGERQSLAHSYPTNDPDEHRTQTRELNDAFRQGRGSGTLAITDGVRALGPAMLATILAEVREFTAFNADNDPYGEHDFGSLDIGGERLFWKIDCYDKQLIYGSPDPTDAAVTARILTIMLASEY